MLEQHPKDGISSDYRTAPFPERFQLAFRSRSGLELASPSGSLSFPSLHSDAFRGKGAKTGGLLWKGQSKPAEVPASKLNGRFLHNHLLHVEAISPISIQVLFSRPLAEEELEPAEARASFKLSSDLELTGPPRLKLGARACYIVPTAPQKPGKRYVISYRGGDKLGFRAGIDRIFFRTVEQISYDTIQIVSELSDHVVDCLRVCADPGAPKNESPIVLSTDNISGEHHYQVVPPLDGKHVLLTPNGGTPLYAEYVPHTQSAEGRQSPQFRLPEGYAFTAGQLYTVSMDWGRVGQDCFSGQSQAPMTVKGLRAESSDTVELQLASDPGRELFAGRSLILAKESGLTLRAEYVPGSRRGAAVDFRLEPGRELEPGSVYRVSLLGPWASTPKIGLKVQLSMLRKPAGRAAFSSIPF